jgi:hypothetical protein
MGGERLSNSAAATRPCEARKGRPLALEVTIRAGDRMRQ